MAFDQRSYHAEVVAPLRDHPDGLSMADLLRQYDVDLTLDRDALRKHVHQVRMFWARKVNGADSSKTVYARLIARDEQLRELHGDRMFDPGWWQDQSAQLEQDLQAEVRSFADDLKRAYGAVGLLTQAQLVAVATHWPGLSERGVGQALQLSGLRVVDVVDLPTGSGMDRTQYRTLSTTLEVLGLPTVVQLLHPGGGAFRLIDPATAVQLDAAVVARRIGEANAAADSSSARDRKDALGLVQSALHAGTDLRELALYQIVERLRAGRAERIADGMLVRKATDSGLEHAEAQVVVANLPATEGPAVPAADRVRDLLQDGRFGAAQQAFTVLPRQDAAWVDLHRLLQDRTDEITALRADAERAMTQGREEEAATLLRRAVRLAVDDEEVTRRLDELAPPPPRDLTAKVHEGEVRLAWEPSRAGATDVRYRVVRAPYPPESAGDGELVAEADAVAATDREPVIATRLHYAVFASTGGDWSRPAVTDATVVPPVAAVQIQVRGDEVVCGYRTHRAAERIRVRRQAGRPPTGERDGVGVDARQTGFVDASAPDSAELYYAIAAGYRDPDGAEVWSQPVVVRVVPRDDAPPFVSQLRVHATAIDAATANVHVSWATPATGTVSVRRSAGRPEWAAGTTVPRAEVEAYGTPVVGDRIVQGPETSVDSVVPSGQFVYVPFTVDQAAGTAVVGAAVLVGVTDPIRDLSVRRAGAELDVTWVWPPTVNLVEVTFAPSNAPASGRGVERRRVSRGQFAESGCRLRTGPDGGRVSVRGISRSQDGDVLSAPVSVVVEGTAVAVTYRLERTGWALNRGGRLVVHVDRPCTAVELKLVAAAGHVLPTSPAQGTVLVHVSDLTLTPQEPWVAAFELPRRLSKPYWLRCFFLNPPGVRVTDPIPEMKVS